MSMDKRVLLCFSVWLIAAARSQPAPDCDQAACVPPDCRCSGTDIPGNLQNGETPQLVFLTFDDAVVTTNFPFYKDELTNRKNPNGHPISATFFVAHEYTDYSFVHELWEDGHEIALHSISHDYNQDYWRSLNQTGWELEVVDQRLQMSTLAAIPESDIKGMRAPQLQMGGDEMHRALHEAKFLWENSRPTLSYRNPGMWPYSNDYKSTQDCRILPCAEGSYPGFWTIPMIDLMSNEEIECSMADACIPIPVTPEETFGMLQKNFLEQYTGNRAPFELSIHAGWVNGTGNETIAERRKGYSQFLDYLATMDDVYIVSISRALEWIKTPVRLADVKDFKPFQAYDRQGACRKTSCRYQTPFEKYVTMCIPCPKEYPWVGNPIGAASPKA